MVSNAGAEHKRYLIYSDPTLTSSVLCSSVVRVLQWLPVEERNMEKLRVGIFIFDNVEVLDFAGPFEVFSRTRTVAGLDSRRSDESAPFEVFTVAKTSDPVTATGGLVVMPHYSWSTAPPIDLLVIPGGFGTRPLLDDNETTNWIKKAAQRSQQVTSVCTGALLLAKAGLLRGRRATTHWGAHDLLGSLDPSITVLRDARVVHDGIVSSAGVSAGIDMAFDVVEQICGATVADETARYIEYPRAAKPLDQSLALPAGDKGAHHDRS